ncbi:serine O-acetyltransferase [Flavobacterium sp.]|uniref:serine O-acetyltransferase n=1 Tax=Flavobacterium sp. TaxID=239 RepID=UPI002FDA7E7C
MINLVKSDLKHHLCGTFYAKNTKVTFVRLFRAFITPEFRVVLAYRIDHFLWKKNLRMLSFIMHQRHKRKYNCDIDPQAIIGKGFRIVHASDIVIGPLALIGNDCVLYNGVTLGNRKGARGDGMPQIGNKVLIGTGAKLLGKITIGENVLVGANSVVLESFDEGTIVGIPAKKS